MTRFLISFDDGAMDIPEEELPAVGAAARAVARDAEAAGVWVLGAGLMPRETTSVVSVDGTVRRGARVADTQYLGGFCIVDVGSRDEALEWAARFAVACRCDQDVREFVPDPEA